MALQSPVPGRYPPATFAVGPATSSATPSLMGALPRDPGLEALLRLTSDGVLVIDRQGRVVFANPTAAAALGFADPATLRAVAPAELVQQFTVEEPDGGTAPLTAFPGTHLFRATRDVERESEIGREHVLRFQDPAGGWERWVLVRARPFLEENAQGSASLGQPGPLRAVLAHVQDISKERRRENAARFLEEATSRLTRSLVRERVLQHAAVAGVPYLGDETVVALKDESGRFRPVSWYLPGLSSAERAESILQGFQPLLAQMEVGAHAMLVAPSTAGPGLSATGSMILVPIQEGAAHELVGVMVLAMATDTARSHHPSDLALAEQLADRVATALANSRLLEGEQRRLRSSQERAVSARRVSDTREARIAHVTAEVRQALSPLLTACELLDRQASPAQRSLLTVIQRQSQRLRGLAELLDDHTPQPDRTGNA